MVNAVIHIICGNCGNGDPDMMEVRTWPGDEDDPTCAAIVCKNCTTIHYLDGDKFRHQDHRQTDSLRARIAELEAEIQCANDAASDYRTTVNVLAESLGVEYEPHQTYTDRIYDAIQRLQKDMERLDWLANNQRGFVPIISRRMNMRMSLRQAIDNAREPYR